MFALFEDGSTIIMGDRRLRSLRLLNQRLWMFALFLLWQATKSSARTLACKQAQEEKRIVPIVSIVFKTSASKERKRTEKVVIKVISH